MQQGNHIDTEINTDLSEITPLQKILLSIINEQPGWTRTQILEEVRRRSATELEAIY